MHLKFIQRNLIILTHSVIMVKIITGRWALRFIWAISSNSLVQCTWQKMAHRPPPVGMETMMKTPYPYSPVRVKAVAKTPHPYSPEAYYLVGVEAVVKTPHPSFGSIYYTRCRRWIVNYNSRKIWSGKWRELWRKGLPPSKSCDGKVHRGRSFPKTGHVRTWN